MFGSLRREPEDVKVSRSEKSGFQTRAKRPSRGARTGEKELCQIQNSLSARSHSHRYVPGYIRHPEKWIKYDLREDGTEKVEGMSADQINKMAALQFLKIGSGSAEDESTQMGTSKEVMFVRPCVTLDGSVTSSNVHALQEYEVGMKREEKRERRQHSCATQVSSHPIHLAHLEEDALSD